MSATQLVTVTPASGRPLERVALLADVIREGGDEAQRIRRVPDATVDALIDAGLFRFTIPRELGGEDATVGETIEVLEAMAAIDASVAWNVMLGSEVNAMAAGGMDKTLAKEVYLDNPRVVMCGGGGPGSTISKAVYQSDGGVKVWGRSTFISGCHNSDWCFMIALVFEDDAPKLVDGRPVVRTWFLPRSEWTILDTWDVSAIRGSGSHDVVADGAYIPPRFAEVELMVYPALYDNPVFRIPVPLRLAYNKAAIGLGVARGALDAFVALAQTKKPMASAALLKDRPTTQLMMGECEARFLAARHFLLDAMAAVESELHRGAEYPSAAGTQYARLACTHAAQTCAQIVDEIHLAAGTSAARMDSPLERKLRDARGAASHRWVARPIFGELGSVLLGNEPSPEFAGGIEGPALGG
jgi:alkylation response protein AidB-like acyl-CoA dehydrogenase